MTHGAAGQWSLRTILMPMSVPERAHARLTAEFPEIHFVVPGSDTSGHYVETPDEPDEEDLRSADAIVAWRVPVEMLAAAPRVRWIQTGGAGVNAFDLAAIAERGVVLTNASGVAAPNMAEHMLGMMIALTRRIPRLVLAQAERSWRDHQTHLEVSELQGQTLLVVGTGDIGCAVAVRAAAFGMTVNGVRRRPGGPSPDGFSAMYGIESLSEALVDADHVAITLPDTPGTRGLFDAVAFAAMKPGAMIYNVGRGPVVDTEALIAALQLGHVGGAGLDVTDPEPLPEASPLWAMDQVLITAHTSGSTPRYWDRFADLIADNIRRIQRGEMPRNIVDFTTGY